GEISNSIDIQLNGKGGECNVNGLYLADGNQRVSTKVNIFHNVPECHSSQLFKGILDGESKTSFSGRIYVAKDAQKTEAYQANNNLLASRTAKAYTQPHLEIYADDVKCSHGATVGSLNEDELFYMRSRGIAKDEAKLLQQQAFAYAVLEKVGNANLRERLHSMVERRLRGEFSECSNCSKHCC
ncbi:MAG: SufD family Fe-S cluster assembly protein, partial [Bacteroidales bacterium]|nr:SufD family Fe-S cluster assembly protein [Bacteroidales bacterium]